MTFLFCPDETSAVAAVPPLSELPREDMVHGERVGGGAAKRRRRRRFRMFWRHEELSLQMMRAAMEHHSPQIKATVGVQTVAVPEFFQVSEEGSDGVQDREAVGMDVCVVPLERVSEGSGVSGLQRHSPNIEHAPSLDVPMLQVCRDGGPGGGLHGFPPGQDSTAFCQDGGLHRFPPGQDSTSSCRGGGPQDFLPVQVEGMVDVLEALFQDTVQLRRCHTRRAGYRRAFWHVPGLHPAPCSPSCAAACPCP